jgi:hypothetical protein
MNGNHFKRLGSDGVPFTIQFDNTYLARIKLIKESDWGPYKKSGELTSEGLEFVLNNIERCYPINWKNYLLRLKRRNL